MDSAVAKFLELLNTALPSTICPMKCLITATIVDYETIDLGSGKTERQMLSYFSFDSTNNKLALGASVNSWTWFGHVQELDKIIFVFCTILEPNKVDIDS